MKVVHLQYGSSSSGNYTITLHDLMTENGIESSVLSLLTSFKPKDKKIKWLGKIPNLKSRLDFKLQDFLNKENQKNLGSFSSPIFGTDISDHPLVRSADVIYVHWILNGFLNINSLICLAKLGIPMVFVMHDMWTFTGGCHYSFECLKFQTGCLNCQILSKNAIVDRSAILFQKKLAFFQCYKHLYFIAPSLWMYANATNSKLLKFKQIFHLPNPTSKNYFQQTDNVYRIKKNISLKKRILGFGANYINSPYKGFDYLLQALHHLKSNPNCIDFEVLIFGSELSPEILRKIPFPVHYTGYIKSEIEICEIYNAMDVFIVSSIADNLPTTVLESLSCGTPVVGFTTGGIPDMIDHKKNGYLAIYKDSSDLSLGINFCLENNTIGYLNKELRQDEIIKKHFNLIETILPISEIRK